MAKIQARRALLCSAAFGLFLPTLAACVETGSATLKSPSDWSTLVTGPGNVETRVVNDSSEAITVRIKDESDQVIAQAPLPPHGKEMLRLPAGSVQAVVRVLRDGRATYSDPKSFQVAPADHPAEWTFIAPTVE